MAPADGKRRLGARTPRLMAAPQRAPDPAGDALIAQALAVLAARLACGPVMGKPADVASYLRLKQGGLGYELFSVMFLSAQGELIAHEELFRGTLTQTAVYPREIAKRALHHNANAIVFCHNHPSGYSTPSEEDKQMTAEVAKGLKHIGVAVLDHIVVSARGTTSFAELGLL
jgi:DNA repair protein RadC